MLSLFCIECHILIHSLGIYHGSAVAKYCTSPGERVGNKIDVIPLLNEPIDFPKNFFLCCPGVIEATQQPPPLFSGIYNVVSQFKSTVT